MIMRWLKSLQIYKDRRMLTMLGLGFSSGFPFLLVSSTLSLWLKDSGLAYGIIGAFAYMIYFYIRYGHKKFVEEFILK